MKDIFTSFYNEWLGAYNVDFDLLFQYLYDDGSYVTIGFSFILITLGCWSLFYFLWKYPYGRIYHWLIFLAFVFILVFASTYGITNTEIFSTTNSDLRDALADTSTGYESFAVSLAFKLAIYNSVGSIVLSFLFSIFLKRFSKIQIHLPI